MNSNLGKLNVSDFAKGVLLAFLTALITGLYNAIQNGGIEFTWIFFKPILLISFGAALAYIIKNWLTNSSGEFLTKEK